MALVVQDYPQRFVVENENWIVQNKKKRKKKANKKNLGFYHMRKLSKLDKLLKLKEKGCKKTKDRKCKHGLWLCI